MTVRVECEDESGTGSTPPTVRVLVDGWLVSEVKASIERKQGADGGWYPCVVFKQVDCNCSEEGPDAVHGGVCELHPVQGA